MTMEKNQKEKEAELFQAVMDCNLKEISRLVEEGADVNARNDKSETPLHTVVNEIIRLAKETFEALALKTFLGGEEHADCFLALTMESLVVTDTIDHLIKLGADVNAKDSRGMSPLQLVKNVDTEGNPLVKQIPYAMEKAVMKRKMEKTVEKIENEKAELLKKMEEMAENKQGAPSSKDLKPVLPARPKASPAKGPVKKPPTKA